MKPLTPLRAIRVRCGECAGSPRAATTCEKEGCPLHPYRTGRNPARTGIGRHAPIKDPHSGKFCPSQDGRNVGKKLTPDSSTPESNLGASSCEIQASRENASAGQQRRLLRAAKAFLREVQGE